MALSDFTIIRRSMVARLFSTVTTIITVAVAVGLMLVLLSMRDAGRQAFSRGSGNMHMLIGPGGVSPLVAVLDGVFYANPPRRPIPWAKYEQIRREIPILEFAIPTQQGDSYRGFPVVATTGEFFSRFMPDAESGWRFAAGRAFESVFEVVVGSQVAGVTGLRVGDSIYLTHGIGVSRSRAESLGAAAAPAPHEHREFSYMVVGVLAPTGSAHDRALFTDLDSTWIIHAHDRRAREDHDIERTTIEHVTDEDRQITGILLRVATRAGSLMSGAQQQVFDLLRRDTTITVADPVQEITNLFTIVSNIDRVFLGMAAVVMVSSAIAIMLALYNSMEQRRRQVAVLRVLGCSRGRIFSLVMTESALIGLIGAAAGLLLTFAGSQIVAGLMKERLGLVIHPVYDPAVILAVTMATVVLACIAGLIPAGMAYRTPVAEHLRPVA
jgi:putative ABC transport system permease protein